MVSSSALRENWDHLRKQILQKWSQFTEGDLLDFDGTADQLIARIQKQTGESRESIQDFLQSASTEGTNMINRVKEQVDDGMTAARETAEHVAERARHGYQEVQTRVSDSVQEHPGISLAAAFGVGVLTGVALALLLFDSEPEPMTSRYSRKAEKLGRRFWNTIAESMPEAISQRMS